MELNTFISRLFSAAEAAGIAPAEAACSQSDSFRVRVRRGELEDYQVSENAGLTLRGRVNGRIGTASTQALTEESIPLLIQGVLESAALIETDEQDDILPPDDSYASVCNDSEAVTALTAEQKIALARALYKDALFIILDKPTAALDPIAENKYIRNSRSWLAIRRRSIFPIVFLPAGFARQSRYLMKAGRSRAARMGSFSPQLGSIPSFGMRRRNTIRKRKNDDKKSPGLHLVPGDKFCPARAVRIAGNIEKSSRRELFFISCIRWDFNNKVLQVLYTRP